MFFQNNMSPNLFNIVWGISPFPQGDVYNEYGNCSMQTLSTVNSDEEIRFYVSEPGSYMYFFSILRISSPL